MGDGLSHVSVIYTSDFALVLSKEFLDTGESKEAGFTLKRNKI